MSSVPEHFYRQSGVIAERRRDGLQEILLVTSRSRKRLVIPKGVVDEGLSPAESAVKEAWEEGGVRGRIGSEPLGRYRYRKWGGLCTVEVYHLAVEEVHESWPEAVTRKRKWLDPAAAAAAVKEEGLQEIIAAFSQGAGEGR